MHVNIFLILIEFQNISLGVEKQNGIRKYKYLINK